MKRYVLRNKCFFVTKPFPYCYKYKKPLAARPSRSYYHMPGRKKVELREWLPRLAVLRERAGEVYVSFNNHYRGQAVANARMIREMIGSAGV